MLRIISHFVHTFLRQKIIKMITINLAVANSHVVNIVNKNFTNKDNLNCFY